MKFSGRLRLALLLGIVLGNLPTVAWATPKHALRVGQRCNLCHTNPSGAGQRATYASQYLLPERIAMLLEKEAAAEEEAMLPDPQISNDVLIGVDLRTFYFQEFDRERLENFVQMQGSLYLSFQLNERFQAYVHQDFGQRASSTHEIYGLGYVLPFQGYVKVGRFVPAFGWRQADHRTFTRQSLVFLLAAPPHSDQGIEVGISPGDFEFQGAITNGAYGGGFDSNDELAFIGRGAWRASVSDVNLTVGGSIYRNKIPFAGDPTRIDQRLAGGPFGGISWRGITWLGEFDWVTQEFGTNDVTSFTTSQELAVPVRQGLDLVGTYDFHDPDVDFETGSVTRVGVGFEAIPYPFLALRAMFNLFDVEPIPAGTPGNATLPTAYSADFDQISAQVHFLY